MPILISAVLLKNLNWNKKFREFSKQKYFQEISCENLQLFINMVKMYKNNINKSEFANKNVVKLLVNNLSNKILILEYKL